MRGRGSEDGVAVVVEHASAGQMLPLLMSDYALTGREREVVRLIRRGRSTAQSAASSSVTLHTVQQHLKSVFAKTGVHSRRDLVGLFLSGRYRRSATGTDSVGPMTYAAR
ncbi:helix-turn-helix transcriptional regulator [Streptomyces sp. NPDC096311]|uniref:helix-turn-helix domain-containing protein n=1 Tax=Streptomyces sp. NPDC096311 TaxID=3366083 RepID=UPI0038133518